MSPHNICDNHVRDSDSVIHHRPAELSLKFGITNTTCKMDKGRVLIRTRTLVPCALCIGLVYFIWLKSGLLTNQRRESPFSPNLPFTPTSTVHSSSNVTAEMKRLHVIPIFSIVTDPKFDKNEFVNPSKLEERMLDFLESLQYTLDHKLVAEVHLLHDQDNMPSYITSKLGHHAKLTFRKVDNAYNASIVMQYVHQHLLSKLVMVTNGDVYPGEGFEKIDYDVMMAKRLFYSPVRHGRQEKRCKMVSNMCGRDYSGAHDTYIFIPTQPFPREGLDLLKDYNWDSWALEYKLLYLYKSILHYKLLNPCKVLSMYHNHCSNARRKPSVRRPPRVFTVQPSDQLQ